MNFVTTVEWAVAHLSAITFNLRRHTYDGYTYVRNSGKLVNIYLITNSWLIYYLNYLLIKLKTWNRSRISFLKCRRLGRGKRMTGLKFNVDSSVCAHTSGVVSLPTKSETLSQEIKSLFVETGWAKHMAECSHAISRQRLAVASRAHRQQGDLFCTEIRTISDSPWARYRNQVSNSPGDFWRQWFLDSSVCVFSISACLQDELLCF